MAQSQQDNDGFNAWVQMMGLQGNNMIPMSSVQMAEQSTPGGIGAPMPPSPLMLPEEMEQEPPPPPMPTPLAPQKVPLTAKPTTQPLGTVPQEIVPSQQGPGPVRKLSLTEEIDLAHKNYSQGLGIQQKEISKLKEGLDQYAQQSGGVDFTPLAAMLDSWYGGKLTDAAKSMAPETAAQKSKNISEMQAKIAEAQGRLSKDELAGLQQRLSQLGYQEQRAMQREIAQINADARKSGIMQERLLQHKADKLEQNVQKLEKRIGDMAPGIISKYQNLDKLIPGGISGDVNLDVPGVGPGMFAVPDIFLSDEASEIQSVARGLMADYLKLQSGTAASDKEVDRKLKEFGMTPGSKSSTFRSGLKRLKEQTIKEMKNKQSGFSPEVVQIYKERGGLTDEDVLAIGQGGEGGGDINDDLNADLTNMSAEELDAWIQRQGGQ